MREFGMQINPQGAALRLGLAGILILVVGVLGGCGEEAAKGQAQRPGMHPGKGPPQEAVAVAVDAAFIGPIASYYDATATLDAEKEAELLARVAGVVESILVEEGDRVAKDAALLRVDNDAYRLRVEQSAATVANLESRYRRIETMHEAGDISEEEYQAAQSDLVVAKSEEGLARLDLSYTTVRAPFAGRITRRLADPGQNLSVGTPLFVLADFDPLLANVHVPSREFGMLRQDQSVELILDSSGEKLDGRIKLISPVIDPASGTIKITVEVAEYPQGTRPGDFAQLRIVTEKHEEALLVPRAALLADEGEMVVFVARADSALVAERRVVEPGFSDDEHAEILSGLLPGEKVVVKGQRSLKDGMPLKVLGDAPKKASS